MEDALKNLITGFFNRSELKKIFQGLQNKANERLLNYPTPLNAFNQLQISFAQAERLKEAEAELVEKNKIIKEKDDMITAKDKEIEALKIYYTAQLMKQANELANAPSQQHTAGQNAFIKGTQDPREISSEHDQELSPIQSGASTSKGIHSRFILSDREDVLTSNKSILACSRTTIN